MLSRSASSVLAEHVSLELEGIDRLYLNLYVPWLQYTYGVVGFIRRHLGLPIASTAALAPMSRRFVASIERFARRRGIDLITFRKGQRKDDIAHEYLAKSTRREGLLFIGKAQEKARVPRTETRRDAQGKKYPWIVPSTAMVNHYYFYILDRDFGPLFIKFCSYFPYTAKVCLNGNEWLKNQLCRHRIGFEPLDNGILSCSDPKRAQHIANALDPKKIEDVILKWMSRLPHPFTDAHIAAGYTYDVSVLQAEFCLTQVLDRPLAGRCLFEELIRENLDLGRPDRVQLIFQRRISRKTPGSFRTRVITDGVVPSLRVQYRRTTIKQYHKEGRALRTETTINDTKDFGIGRRLQNLPTLRQIGYRANRRLLDVQTMSHDCMIGHDTFTSLHRGTLQGHQRAPALRFGDPRVMALMAALVVFRLQPTGFQNKHLRAYVAHLLGQDPASYKPGRMTYDLRRLRLHGIIERVPFSHSYRLTDYGTRIALFYSRAYSRFFRTAFSIRSQVQIPPLHDIPKVPWPHSWSKLVMALDRFLEETQLCA
jgi:hypothetical protein